MSIIAIKSCTISAAAIPVISAIGGKVDMHQVRTSINTLVINDKVS